MKNKILYWYVCPGMTFPILKKFTSFYTLYYFILFKRSKSTLLYSFKQTNFFAYFKSYLSQILFLRIRNQLLYMHCIMFNDITLIREWTQDTACSANHLSMTCWTQQLNLLFDTDELKTRNVCETCMPP